MLSSVLDHVVPKSLLGGLILLAGCVTTDPNGADTFTKSGVLSGSILTEEACNAWQDTAVWVVVDGQGECLRYFHAGLAEKNEAVHVWFHGDRMTQWLDGRAQVHGYYTNDASPGALQQQAASRFQQDGVPYIRFSRPGLYGSSGDHRERRLLREVQVVDAALDALVDRYKIGALSLSGQSGGGHIVGSLLTRRDDIACAIASSGVLAVEKRSFIRGWGGRDITGFTGYFDPIDHVTEVPVDADRRIFIVGDPNDTNVPFSTQAAFYDALVAAGHDAVLIRANARGSSSHSLSREGQEIAADCVLGRETADIVATYSAQ